MGLHFVEPQRLHDAERIALPVKALCLQCVVQADKRHHAGLGAERLKEIGGNRAARRADLEPGEITGIADPPYAGGDVMKTVLQRMAKRVQPGPRELAADDVAKSAVER